MLMQQPTGNYTFIKGIGPFCSGCKAQPDYEIVHARFHPLSALNAGFGLIECHLQSLGRPIQALCGMELRIPQSLSAQAFAEFNTPYITRLTDWDLPVDRVNPVARTNVAPAAHPPAEPAVYGFSYTVPSQYRGATFILSGSAETQRRSDGSEGYEIVSHGDVSPEGLAKKADYVLDTLAARLQELEVGWTDVTTVQLYTVHDIHALLETSLLPAQQSRHGLQWHYARPPVTELEYEMDARGVRQECIVSGV